MKSMLSAAALLLVTTSAFASHPKPALPRPSTPYAHRAVQSEASATFTSPAQATGGRANRPAPYSRTSPHIGLNRA